MATPEQLTVMAEHYLIAAIWADCPEGTHPRATRQARDKASQICQAFAIATGPLLTEAVTRDGYGDHPDCGAEHPAYVAAGHDLWLTSQGHGVGFWDRDSLDAGGLGDRLSDVAKQFSGTYAEFYRGWLYLHG